MAIQKKYVFAALAVLVLALTVVCSGGALAEDDQAIQNVLRVTVAANPAVLGEPSDIALEFHLKNTSEAQVEGGTLVVTLFSPIGERCRDFGEQGIARIPPGEAVHYSTVFPVTEAQLDGGSLSYLASYTLKNAAGQQVSIAQPITLPVILKGQIPAEATAE